MITLAAPTLSEHISKKWYVYPVQYLFQVGPIY